MALGSLLSAPSSASTKKVTEAVALVRRIYTSLESMGLIGSSYPCRLELYDTQMDLPDHERVRVQKLLTTINRQRSMTDVAYNVLFSLFLSFLSVVLNYILRPYCIILCMKRPCRIS